MLHVIQYSTTASTKSVPGHVDAASHNRHSRHDDAAVVTSAGRRRRRHRSRCGNRR